MEESGSIGLDELLISRKDTPFMQEVDYVCISDNYWLGKDKPCLTYGLRGVCYFFMEVECCSKDLHSGVFGGTVHEGMADLVAMMNTLLSKEGEILVTGLSDSVAPLTPEEKASYEGIDFDVKDYASDVGTKRLITVRTRGRPSWPVGDTPHSHFTESRAHSATREPRPSSHGKSLGSSPSASCPTKRQKS
ncbi:Cytosolic non-specific dipeptidase [Caligus rogercresseyi]|uniref:Cytosolic non-specific dipeptidase n=1 Tax=Caligus rogercresseyi TaxID=217165 RepID=A0A7T8GNA5_CALRO|nr:Cytosolic non-specific dipeptidase [Caligus rogercresseyi]